MERLEELRCRRLRTESVTGRRRQLRLEALESRKVLAIDAVQVADINAVFNDLGSNPANLTYVDGTLFFSATTTTTGVELWKSDGTASGTQIVADINPGTTGSSLSNLISFAGQLFFVATDGSSGSELWKSNGTAAGTVMVADINPGSGSSSPSSLTVFNGALYFSATTTANGTELWKSDGTTAGTVRVTDIAPSGASSDPDHLTVVGSTLFFTAAQTGTSGTGNELWKTDGTTAGTTLVKDIAAGTASSTPDLLTAAGTRLFFTAKTAAEGYELWVSDGTTAGTNLVRDLTVGTAPTSVTIGSLTAVGSSVFFTVPDTATGTELWISDGSAGGTVQVKDIFPGASSSSPASLVNYGGTLYFTANDGTNGIELWKSDGTSAGTTMVVDLRTPGSGNPSQLTVFSGSLYFRATTASGGTELWKTNGTSLTTSLVADIVIGTGSSTPGNLTPGGTTLFFTADDGTSGRELWATVANSAGAFRVADIVAGTQDSAPANLVNFNGAVYFAATNGTAGVELWKSDGTSAGTVMVKDIRAGSSGSNVANLTKVGNTLYFSATTTTNGNELWKSDGTDAGTQLVKDIVVGGGGSNPSNLVNVNGTLFFTANDGTTGLELWTSDGTASGTVRVADIAPGTTNSNPAELTAAGSTVYFRATDGVNGTELWKSDGTAAGTTMVRDIRSGTNGSSPTGFVVIGGTLYFSANDGVVGAELWRSDGSTDGTTLVADILTGTASSSSSPTNLVNLNGTLIFAVGNGPGGSELWRSDGTTLGTVRVKDIRPSTSGSSPAELTVVGNSVFFTANDGTTGVELWKSDGTDAGTVRVADIRAGVTSSTPSLLTAANNGLFFAVNDGVHGEELWRSDGTAEGTILVRNIAVPGSSTPTSLTAVGDQVFFAATTNSFGNELWRTFDAPILLVTQTGSTITVTDSTSYGRQDHVLLERDGANLKLTDLAGGTFNVSAIAGATGHDTSVARIPFSAFGTTGNLAVELKGGIDKLTVDFSAGSPVPVGGIDFFGGSPTSGSPGDELVVQGGVFSQVVSTHGGPDNGSVSLDGAVVRYAGLEPVTLDVTAITLTEQLPAAGDTTSLSITDADNDLQFDDLVINSVTGTHEDVIVRNVFVYSSIVLDGGQGDDLITLDDSLAAFTNLSGREFVVGGATGVDSIVVAAGVTLTANTDQSAAVDLQGGTLRLSNNATLDSLQDSTSPGAVVTNGYRLTVGDSSNTTFDGVISGSGPLTKQGSGRLTLTGDHSFTGSTTVASGTLVVTGTLTSGAVTVNSTGALAGTGTLYGNLSVQSAATVRPGFEPASSAGVLTVASGLTGSSGGTLAFDLGGLTAGSQYDQIVVNGTVTLNGLTLATNLFNGYVPSNATSQSLTILDNDGVDAVVGTFQGLPEGASVPVPGSPIPVYITYQGGDGNDVVLTTRPAVNGRNDWNDLLTVRRAAGGVDFEYQLNDGAWVNLGPVSSLSDFTFRGLDGHDLLTVDLVNGNPIPAGGLFFFGGSQTLQANADVTPGAQTGDALRMVGTGVETLTWTPSATTPGSGVLDLSSHVLTFVGLDSFDGMAPAIEVSQVAVAAARFPDGATSDAELLSLRDGLGVSSTTATAPAYVLSGTTGGVVFTPVAWRANGTVGINTTTWDGDDVAAITGGANGHGNAVVSLELGAGSDVVDLSSGSQPMNVTLASLGATDGFSGSVGPASGPMSGSALVTFANVQSLVGSTANGSAPGAGDNLTLNLDSSATWQLTSANAGAVTLDGAGRSFAFSAVEHLTGAATASDRFVFAAGTTLSGWIDARGPNGVVDSSTGQILGGDVLDYSAFAASVSVNLSAGTAGNVGGLATDSLGSSIEHVEGSANGDSLVGDADVNRLRGGEGADTLNGRGGIDWIDAAAGDDTLSIQGAEAAFDRLLGGVGFDTLINVGASDVTLDRFNPSFDATDNGLERFSGGGWSLVGNGGVNGLHGGFVQVSGTASIGGADGADDVTTSTHHESLVAYDGGAGTDRVTLAFTPEQLGALTTSDLLAVQAFVRGPTGQTLSVTSAPEKGRFTATNFESARVAALDDGVMFDITSCFQGLSSAAQIRIGTDANESLTGTTLGDLIFGRGGDDWIDALDGANCVFGGAGRDTIVGGNGNDLLVGGRDDDSLSGGAGSDLLRGDSGNDLLSGDDGFDNLEGGDGDDVMYGGLNDDRLDGGPGVDSAYGESGYDTIVVRREEARWDVMNGGENTDTIQNDDPAAPVVLRWFDAGVSQIEGWNGAGAPIEGDDDDNWLNFQLSVSYSMTITGVPYIDGKAGDDTITGTNGADVLRGGAGRDTLYGQYGSDSLDGGPGDDSLYGGEGVDYLFGAEGNDWLSSGGGRDILYFLNTDSALDLDVVFDFTTSDRLSFQGLGWSLGQLIFDMTTSPGDTIIGLPNGKRIRLVGRTSPPPSYVFLF